MHMYVSFVISTALFLILTPTCAGVRLEKKKIERGTIAKYMYHGIGRGQWIIKFHVYASLRFASKPQYPYHTKLLISLRLTNQQQKQT